MALLRCELDDRLPILWCYRVCGQLAQYRFPVRIRGHLTPYHLYPPSRRTEAVYSHRCCLPLTGELDQIWIYESRAPGKFWRSDVWSDPYRICAAFRPGSPHQILRFMVHQSWKNCCYSRHELSESVWRCSRAINRPVLGGISRRYTEYGALYFHHRNYCNHSLILHPGRSTNTMLTIWRTCQATSQGLHPVPLFLSGVLLDHDTIRRLRRAIQQRLLSNQSDSVSLQLFGN